MYEWHSKVISTDILQVAVNKQQTEDVIDAMLLTLQHQYRRIQMVKDVYNTDDMKKYTAIVYRLGVEFLYEAVRYYSIGTIHRLAYIIKRPPSIQLTIKVAEIEAAIEDMRKEMDILDGIKLNKVGQRLENVAESVHDIEKSVHGRWACAIVDVIVLKTVSIAST
jgi:deoxyribose-phosphate aldolase